MKQFEGKLSWDLCTNIQTTSPPGSKQELALLLLVLSHLLWYWFPGYLGRCHLNHFCKHNLRSMAFSLPLERIWYSSASCIGTDISKLMLLHVPHVMAYSLAMAVLMLSWLLGGRITAVPTPSLCHQPFPLQSHCTFQPLVQSSYDRRAVTCPGNWSTVLIPVNYVLFLGPKEVVENIIFFLPAQLLVHSLVVAGPTWMFTFSQLSRLLTITRADVNPAWGGGHSRQKWLTWKIGFFYIGSYG